MIYIQKYLTLGYTIQVLNLFNSHSFSNVGLTHIHEERGEGLKETDSGVYRKGPMILVLKLREKLMKLL